MSVIRDTISTKSGDGHVYHVPCDKSRVGVSIIIVRGLDITRLSVVKVCDSQCSGRGNVPRTSPVLGQCVPDKTEVWP